MYFSGSLSYSKTHDCEISNYIFEHIEFTNLGTLLETFKFTLFCTLLKI
jgi:hypothetical protein